MFGCGPPVLLVMPKMFIGMGVHEQRDQKLSPWAVEIVSSHRLLRISILLYAWASEREPTVDNHAASH